MAEIAEYLVEDAHNDFEGMEHIEVEIKLPEKFIETKEYKPAGMSARELIEEAGIDRGIFRPRLSEDRCSVLVTLNQWEQSDPPTSFGALEVKIAEKTAFCIGNLLGKKGKDPAIAKTIHAVENPPFFYSVPNNMRTSALEPFAEKGTVFIQKTGLDLYRL